MTGVAAVVLAAGGSSRMGRPKQLLSFGGESLVRHAAGVATAAGFDPVFVVLGAAADAVRADLDGMAVTTVMNPDWEAGPGTSVRAGMTAIDAHPDPIDAVVFLLCDQPFVTATHLGALRAAQVATGRPIAASGYAGTTGVPALFARECFPELRGVPPDAGAKRLIARDPARVAVVPFPGGAIDLDTPADYAEWSAGRPERSLEESNGPGQ